MKQGFNHNLRHQGVLFHIQTEDSGVNNPVVVTHVFVGGNIIATRRANYEKFVGRPGLAGIVESIMKEQHKDVMKDMVNGKIRSVELAIHEARAKESGAAKAESETEHSGEGTMKERSHVSRASRPTAPSDPTLDTGGTADKSLDELILDFLSSEPKKKK